SGAGTRKTGRAVPPPLPQPPRQWLVSLRVALPYHHAVQVHREAIEEPALLDRDVDDLLAVLALDRVLHRAVGLIGSPERDDVQDQHPGRVAFGVAELLILRGVQLDMSYPVGRARAAHAPHKEGGRPSDRDSVRG